jgi:hypothetical protein
MRRRRTAGFGLLEVVIGLAIAALGLAALYQAGAFGLFAVETAGRVEEGLQRAQSHLALIGRDAALAEGDAEGDDGGGYRWHLRVARKVTWEASADAAGLAPRTLFDVEVAISWRTGGRERFVTLSTQQLGLDQRR